MIHLILVKFRGKWSIDCTDSDIYFCRRQACELRKTNEAVKVVTSDTNDPRKLEKIVKEHNKSL